MLKKLIFVFFLCFILILIGCAAEVRRFPTKFLPMSSQKSQGSLYLTEDVIIQLHTGYETLLQRESRWDFVGAIDKGNVYKPINQVLTVEGAHIHEAYIVISKGELVGFYLPVENCFSPLLNKHPLPIK